MKNIFKKNQKTSMTESEVYAYMGSLGVSHGHVKMFQESINKIKEHEDSTE
jgi:hypothetical protein